MAQALRTVAAAAAVGSAGRVHAGLRPTASVDRSPIEGITTKNNAFLDDSGFLYQEYSKDGLQGGDGFGGSGSRGRRPALPSIGPMRATSQAYAAFLEYEGGASGVARGTLTGGAAMSNMLISRAINIYETNSRIIHDAPAPIGSSLSLML